ncbi:MAG: dihydrolipoyl dehydrogenase family protein [Saccharofermentanales bacterium]|jgi:mycothione reductase
MKQFDLVVIGAGAGVLVVEAALEQGLRCALIEKAKFGGTCLTKGCIPSKMLVLPADMIREAAAAKRIGLDFSAPEIDWDLIGARMWKQINRSQALEKNLTKIPELTLYKGTATFTGPSVLRVQLEDGSRSDELTGKKILIAAGARTFIPPVSGLEEAGYVTAETFFGDKFPSRPWQSLAIIGGGAIGSEFAHIFSAFGTKVSIVEMRDHLMTTEEEEVSVFAEKQFRANGIDIFTSTTILSVGTVPGGKALRLRDTAGKEQTLTVEEVLIASGVRSNADWLGLDKAGIKVDGRGWIITNEYLETSQSNIWALGDINGKYQFRHTANFEAETLIRNWFSADRTLKAMSYSTVPWAIFTSPQIAHVGLTEREIKRSGQKYWVGYNHYSQVTGGIAMGYSRGDEDDGFIKIIVGEEHKILGVHIVGPHAAILLQPFVYMMNSGQKCPDNIRKTPAKLADRLRGLRIICPPLGTYQPINDSMVIHPALSELTAWVIDSIDWTDTRR